MINYFVFLKRPSWVGENVQVYFLNNGESVMSIGQSTSRSPGLHEVATHTPED